jgi:anti-anti-sigma regulatory factor
MFRFNRLRGENGRSYEDIVSDKDSYYLVRLPRNMTQYRNSFIGEVIGDLGERELPIVIDFSRVEDFDVSGVAALFSIWCNYPHRGKFAVSASRKVWNTLEVAKLDEVIRKGFHFCDDLESLINSGILGRVEDDVSKPD